MRVRSVIAGGALTAAAVAVSRRLLAVREVPAELRRPMLLLPLSITNTVALRLLRASGPPPVIRADVRVAEHRIAGSGAAGAHVFEPAERTASGALLWIHGGGYVGGAAAMDHAWCAQVAAELGVVVVSAEYRLAPEHPFPAALDDCTAVLRWLHGEAQVLGIDPDRIAVGGASAGGGLAAAVVQRAHDDGPPVAFQQLVYPMLDDRTVLRPDDAGRGRFVWTPGSNRFGWTSYLGRAPGGEEPRPYAVPAHRADLRGLPAAWIGVGDLDLFFEEDAEYARRLTEAGVPCEFVREPGMYHGADAIAIDAPSMVRFRARMLAALRPVLSEQPVP